jgi:uncharacterized membrane protein
MKVFLYCLKIWLASVVAGNMLFYVVGYPTDDSSMTFWGYMAVACLGATIYSFVSFLLFWLGVFLIARRHFSAWRKRGIATVWAMILVIAPFPMLFGRNHPNWAMLAVLCGCYLVPLLVGVWVFKFPTVLQPSFDSNP